MAITTIAAIGLGGGIAWLTRQAIRMSGDDPAVWEGQIRRFERSDREAPPTGGGVVFTGSSSIRAWGSLERDLAPLPAINRGFGGAKLHQVTYFLDRIVVPQRPKAVVLYAGENDLVGPKARTPEQVRDGFREFCAAMQGKLPGVPVYFLSIKPSRRAPGHWPVMRQANALIKADCRAEDGLRFIDIATAMLGPDGAPRRELFRWDGSHLSPQGYALWTGIVKPVLEDSLLRG